MNYMGSIHQHERIGDGKRSDNELLEFALQRGSDRDAGTRIAQAGVPMTKRGQNRDIALIVQHPELGPLLYPLLR